tara:strand:+ start:5794 stop:9987 length:4194 start_codon:yes stop_codon:yes gene_type:complete
MSNTQPLYDIQGYSDNELYDILDLVNPSDRELEAKILMEIHKYENINTKSARKLAIFFDEIYNHFFESEEDAVEGFAGDGDGDGEYAPGGKDESIAKEKYRLQDQDSRDAGQDTTRIQDDDFETTAEDRTSIENRLANATSSKDFFDSFDPDNATGKEDVEKTTKYRGDRAGAGAGDSSKKQIGSTEVYKQSNISPDKIKKSQIGYTRALDYARGKLNPIMKETIKRIISIDSQYRSDKRTFSTDFTFNLSEPLKDVISLKLYSVQIPYTWYTIGKAYGNNFFYFKGRTPGIDTDSHDIKIEILAGNYKPGELIDTVNGSIDVIKSSTTDISLGNTSLSYNPNTSLTTSIIDLKKSYNESSYVINFDEPTIPSYLGFIDTEYNCRTIRSKIDTYGLTNNFNVTENNNYFTVNIYQDNSTTIDNSFGISVTPAIYTRASIITELNTVLSNEPRLTNTSCSAHIDSNGNNTYIDMSLQLTRAINGVTSSTKTEVVFYEQQHYTVDFTVGLFNIILGTSAIIDISGNIGDEISSTIGLSGLDDSVSVEINQPICTIKTKFHNGDTTQNYNDADVIHTINLDNSIATDYSKEALYEVIQTTITNYEYNGVKIFAGTTVSIDGQMTLKIKADDKIWTNDGSCFGFEIAENRLNEILGETEATEQSGNYTISTTPYVHLIPNTDIYNDAAFNGINDLSFSIPRFGSKNLTQYIDVINESISTYDLTHNNEFNSQGNAPFEKTTAYPNGTYAYLQNQIFQMYFNIDKVFDETMYIIDFSGSIFFTMLRAGNSTNSTMFAEVDANNTLTTDILAPIYTTSTTDSNLYDINSDTIIFTIRPKYSIGNIILNGNEKEGATIFTMGNIPYIDTESNNQVLGTDDRSFQVDDIINKFIKYAITNYKDPLSDRNTFGNIVISEETRQDNVSGFNISLQISIKKTLSAKNYNIHFKDTNPANLSWNANLYISDKLTDDDSINTSTYEIVDMNGNYTIYDEEKTEYSIANNQIDSSGNILDSTGNILDSDGTINDTNNGNKQVSGQIIYTLIPDGNVKISGTQTLISQVPLEINRLNNTFSFKAIEDGVATSTAQNDAIITLPIGSYYRDTLMAEINSQIAQSSSTYSNISGTRIELQRIDTKYRAKIVMNIAREYVTSDFNLVFFDDESFATCVSGASSIQNTTWDTTIGWIMGFREYTTYDMSARGTVEDTVVDSVNGNEITIIGDTGLSTNLYNYFLICLDDFNQSHLNDGLITITNSDTTIPLPSYANRSNFVCDPVTGEKVYSVVNDNVTNRLTEKQIYATQVAANSSNQDSSIGTSVSTKNYGTGPFVSDVFGLIPMKVAGLQNGSSYVEFGGTLQNQERSYFGPVNINRMSVKLVTDRGNLVDLNKANWSFSLICETLNKLEPGT